MSSTIAQPSNMKSMNGIVTYDDGAGTVISGGAITTSNLVSQSVTAPNIAEDSDVYVANTGDVRIGQNSSVLYLRDLYTTLVPGYHFLDTNVATGTAFQLLTSVSAPITIGSNTAPLIGEYVCTAANHLANKSYVDSVASGSVSLSGTNFWTGNNFFENLGKNNTSNNLRIGYNMGTGQQLFIGSQTGDENVVIGIANQGITIGNGANRTAALNICNSNNCVSDIRIASNTTFNGSIHIGDTSTLLPHLYLGSASGVTEIFGNLNISGPTIDVIATTTFGVNAPDTVLFATASTRVVSPICKIESSSLSTGGCVSFDTSVSGTSTMNFLTNATDKTTSTARIVGSGGTSAGTGNLISYAAGNYFFNGDGTQSLRINPNATNAVDLIWRANTSNPSQSSVTMRGESTGTLNDGNLTTYCGKSAVRNSTGNFCAIVQSVGTDTATINFKSSTANDVVSSSIKATGGNSNADSGTLDIDGSILNINNTTTNIFSSVVNFILNGASTLLHLIASPTSTIKLQTPSGASTSVSTVYGDLLFFNGSGTLQIGTAGNKNIKCTEQQFTKLILIGYDCPNGVRIILDQTTTSIMDGGEYQIWNMSANNVVISTNSSGTIANIYGPNLSRSGVDNIILTSNRGIRARAFTAVTSSIMQPPNNLSVGWIFHNNY
jgi:hypothetical protein